MNKVYNQVEASRWSSTIRLKNTVENNELIPTLRKLARTMDLKVRIRCRHHDRVSLFKVTGRYHSRLANQNDMYFGSKEGLMCDEFVCYFDRKDKNNRYERGHSYSATELTVNEQSQINQLFSTVPL